MREAIPVTEVIARSGSTIGPRYSPIKEAPVGLLDKAKDMLKGNTDKVKEGIDKAGDMIDEKTGGKFSDHIETAEEKAGEFLDDVEESAEEGDETTAG